MVGQTLTTLKAGPQVASVTDPFLTGGVNPAGTVGYAQVTFNAASIDLSDAARDGLAEAVTQGRAGGLTVEVGGDAIQETPEQDLTEVIGVAVSAVVLIITFGSLVAAGLPLLTAIIGIALGLGGITIATGFMDLSAMTSTLALMLGLAVAIDCALFIVSRYRHELAVGRDGEEAAGRPWAPPDRP